MLIVSIETQMPIKWFNVLIVRLGMQPGVFRSVQILCLFSQIFRRHIFVQLEIMRRYVVIVIRIVIISWQ